MGERVILGLVLSLATAISAPSQTWERLGPPGGMVISMSAAVDGTVYLGSPDGHIFASVNRGDWWELRGRAGQRLDGVVQQIVPDVRDAKRVLAGIWFRDAPNGGVFESVDGGRSWKAAGLGEEAVRALAQSASDPKVWVAGTRGGVFRSKDDAKSWQRITSANDPELQNVDSLAIDPHDEGTIYVGTYHLPWKTTDGGKTWSAISAGMIDDSDVMSLQIDARNPKRIFSSACSGIYRSDDGGASWIKLQGIPYSSRRTQQIVQDPSDAKAWYAATTEGLWATSDYGETWKRITERETDANAVVVLLGYQGKRVLAGMGAQGILRSDDGGNSFIASNGGFSHRVIISVAADTRDPQRLLARVEGYGAPLQSEDGGRSWRMVASTPSGRSMDRIFSSAGGWWITFSEGGLAKLDADSGRWSLSAFREIVSQAPSRGRRKSAVRVVKPHVSFVLEEAGQTFAATDRSLWRSVGSNAEFRRATAAKTLPQPVTYLTTGGAGTLYAIASGELWSNASGAWNRIAADPTKTSVLLWVHEALQDRQLLMGTQQGVFVSAMGGVWRLIANGLPSIGSVAPALSQGRCLIAMANGSFYESSDRLKTWRLVASDAERGKISKVLVTGRGGFLVASEGEGFLFRKAFADTTSVYVGAR